MRDSYQSVFISDSHLGMRNIDSTKLLSFLYSFDCRNLFLVGDIIDGWALQNRMYWPHVNSLIINEIYRKFLDGTRVYFIPGNHDEVFRQFKFDINEDTYFFQIKDEVIYQALNGKSYLITHGDKYDNVVTKIKWLAYTGAFLYEIVFYLNVKLHKLFKLKWSLSQWSKTKVKHVVSFLENYERTIISFVRDEKLDGIICGHIHHPRIAKIEDIEYMNCGDFIESFSAIIEKEDGRFELKYF